MGLFCGCFKVYSIYSSWCRWVFAPEGVFDRTRLLEFLAAVVPAVQRVKGVFHIVGNWVTPSSCGTCLEPISYRRDSRVEIVAQQPATQHQVIENELNAKAGVDDAVIGQTALARAAAAADWSTVESFLLQVLQ